MLLTKRNLLENISKNIVQVYVLIFFWQATDEDDPSSPNSKVEYSLLNSRVAPYSYFSVDPESGMLNLSSRIDCEAAYRPCNGYLILKVQAEDQGMPHFSDNATIKITVKDINDNSPAFVPSNYTATVYENALTGKYYLCIAWKQRFKYRM